MSRVTLAIVLLMHCLCSHASVSADRYNRLTIDDGLSQNSVYATLRDNQGFMWFGTEDGLNRYDGYQFKHFHHDPNDPFSLSSNNISVIYQDNEGALWVGTQGGGLNRYDRNRQRFIRFVHDENRPHSLSHNNVTAIQQDAAGKLWIGTWGGGLNQFDANQQQFIHFKHQPSDPTSLSQNSVRTMTQDNNHNLWIGTAGGGLNRLDSKAGTFTHYQHQPDNPDSLSHNSVSALFEAQDGSLWVGTDVGLNRFDHNTQSFVRYYHQPDDRFSLSHDNIKSITQDNGGTLWVGTFAGVDKLNGNQTRFSHYRHRISKTEFSQKLVLSLYQDSKGILWIGTLGGGVNKVYTGQKVFGHVKHDARQPASLSPKAILSVYQDSKGVIWLGTKGDGLNYSTNQGKTFESLKHQTDNPNSLSHDIVQTILQDTTGTMWFGTDSGLNRYDPDTKEFNHFKHHDSIASSLSNNGVKVIFEDSKGHMWIGTWGGGLNKFDAEQQQFEHLRYLEADSNRLNSDFITAIIEDPTGRLWVGTDQGLNHFDPATGHFVQPTDNTGLFVVTSLHQDGNGLLWIGTYGSGLKQYDPKTGQWQHFQRKDGLPSDEVYGILEDRSFNLWISTNRGLSSFNPASQTFVSYDVKDGLQSNVFSKGAYFLGQGGEMFFAGINGYNHFKPTKLNDKMQPPVVFTDFLLFNQSVPIASSSSDDVFSLPTSIDTIKQLTLGYEQNLVSFEFAALDHKQAGNNRYAYRLDGFDKKWITADAKFRRANYTNLPAGSYTLQVKAGNADGYWYKQQASIKVLVDPPPWFSWWAWAIYATTVLFLMFSFIHVQRAKVLHAYAVNQQLEQVDKLKDQFLANTSHELRTPLNGIIGLAESLMDGVGGPMSDTSKNNLAMIVSSGKRLSNLVNDILDFSKLKSADLVLHTKAIDMNSLAEVVISLSNPLLGDKDLKLINAIDTSLPAVEADEDRLQQIMHNLIGNAIKFTDSGEITVSGEQQNDQLMISVTDTGIGIEQAQIELIFDSFKQVEADVERAYSGTGLGLAVSKKLVNLHGGQIVVSSTVGMGSTFSFTLPLSNKQAQPGTALTHSVSRLHVLDNEPPIKTEANQSTIDGSEFRILVVDDEAVNRQVVFNHLSLQNYHLFEVSNGPEALKMLETHGPFDLVLLDVMMPKVSGYEVCQQLRQTYSVNELPVLFLTANNQVTDLIQCFSVGANDFLSKPISKHELLTRVETHLKLLDINRTLEHKVAQRTAALEQATQAKSDFLAKMSHEIRTPMNAVIGLSRLALKTKMTHQQQDYVEKVVDAGEALLGLINDILDFSKIEAGKLTIENTRFTLERLLQKAVNLSAIIAHGKGLELVTDVDKNVPAVMIGDPLRLQQIIVNLVNNAVKFTEQGGVCVKVQIKEALNNQLMLHFSVIDTGIGMSAEQQARMFQSFSQADDSVTRKYGGTGLGLAISKQLSELMGGQIWLDSEPGKGSTFHFTVLVEQVTTPADEQTLNPEEIAKLKVLVVDDIQLAREVLVNMLTELGIKSDEAYSGREAIDMISQARQNNCGYDLVLMDWRMPEMDGIETTRLIHQDSPDGAPHVLMVSAYDKDEARSCLNQTKISQFLEKPVGQTALLEALGRVLSDKGNPAQFIEEESQVMETPNLSAHCLLLVEDNAINRQVAIGFLADTGVEIDIAENGLIALAKIHQRDYDVILMDIQMPEMDGITATSEIRNTLGKTDLPVIAMTAHAMATDAERSKAAQMNGHITKPMDPDTLYRTLLEHIDVNAKPAQAVKTVETVDKSPNDETSVMAQLATVSDLDSAQALKKMHGKTSLYLGLVKDFGKDQRNLEQTLQNQFEQRQWKELYRHVHSLKSNAAYIGAYALSSMADTLETALSNSERDKQQLDNLCNMMRPLITAFDDIFADSSQMQPQMAFDAEALKTALTGLLPLLEASDFAAEDALPALTQLCAGTVYADDINTLAEYVDDIEYEKAVEVAIRVLGGL